MNKTDREMQLDIDTASHRKAVSSSWFHDHQHGDGGPVGAPVAPLLCGVSHQPGRLQAPSVRRPAGPFFLPRGRPPGCPSALGPGASGGGELSPQEAGSRRTGSDGECGSGLVVTLQSAHLSPPLLRRC